MDKILEFSGAKIQLLRDLIRLANIILEKRKSIGHDVIFATNEINDIVLDNQVFVSYIRKLAAAAETISKATAVSKDSVELGKILKRELEHVHIKMDSAIEKDREEHDRKAAFESYLTEPVRQAKLDGKFVASYTGKLASAADAILKSTDDPIRLEEAMKDEPAKIQRDMDEEVELALNEAHTQYQREPINEERESPPAEQQYESADVGSPALGSPAAAIVEHAAPVGSPAPHVVPVSIVEHATQSEIDRQAKDETTRLLKETIDATNLKLKSEHEARLLKLRKKVVDPKDPSKIENLLDPTQKINLTFTETKLAKFKAIPFQNKVDGMIIHLKRDREKLIRLAEIVDKLTNKTIINVTENNPKIAKESKNSFGFFGNFMKKVSSLVSGNQGKKDESEESEEVLFEPIKENQIADPVEELSELGSEGSFVQAPHPPITPRHTQPTTQTSLDTNGSYEESDIPLPKFKQQAAPVEGTFSPAPPPRRERKPGAIEQKSNESFDFDILFKLSLPKLEKHVNKIESLKKQVDITVTQTISNGEFAKILKQFEEVESTRAEQILHAPEDSEEIDVSPTARKTEAVSEAVTIQASDAPAIVPVVERTFSPASTISATEEPTVAPAPELAIPLTSPAKEGSESVSDEKASEVPIINEQTTAEPAAAAHASTISESEEPPAAPAPEHAIPLTSPAKEGSESVSEEKASEVPIINEQTTAEPAAAAHAESLSSARVSASPAKFEQAPESSPSQRTNQPELAQDQHNLLIKEKASETSEPIQSTSVILPPSELNAPTRPTFNPKPPVETPPIGPSLQKHKPPKKNQVNGKYIPRPPVEPPPPSPPPSTPILKVPTEIDNRVTILGTMHDCKRQLVNILDANEFVKETIKESKESKRQEEHLNDEIESVLYKSEIMKNRIDVILSQVIAKTKQVQHTIQVATAKEAARIRADEKRQAEIENALKEEVATKQAAEAAALQKEVATKQAAEAAALQKEVATKQAAEAAALQKEAAPTKAAEAASKMGATAKAAVSKMAAAAKAQAVIKDAKVTTTRAEKAERDAANIAQAAEARKVKEEALKVQKREALLARVAELEQTRLKKVEAETMRKEQADAAIAAAILEKKQTKQDSTLDAQQKRDAEIAIRIAEKQKKKEAAEQRRAKEAADLGRDDEKTAQEKIADLKQHAEERENAKVAAAAAKITREADALQDANEAARRAEMRAQAETERLALLQAAELAKAESKRKADAETALLRATTALITKEAAASSTEIKDAAASTVKLSTTAVAQAEAAIESAKEAKLIAQRLAKVKQDTLDRDNKFNDKAMYMIDAKGLPVLYLIYDDRSKKFLQTHHVDFNQPKLYKKYGIRGPEFEYVPTDKKLGILKTDFLLDEKGYRKMGEPIREYVCKKPTLMFVPTSVYNFGVKNLKYKNEFTFSENYIYDPYSNTLIGPPPSKKETIISTEIKKLEPGRAV